MTDSDEERGDETFDLKDNSTGDSLEKIVLCIVTKL